ncbi:MAG: Fic/DOC family N-terminal domain-containing protein [Pyrinomonadaceae bacterium]
MEETKYFLEDFRAGDFGLGSGYRFFIPERIDRNWTWRDPHVSALLEKASIRLGELNSFARQVPNIDIFIRLHATREAVLSSRIEGTSTTMNEAFLPFEEIIPEDRDDWIEVQNYIAALRFSISELKSKKGAPLSSRLLRMAHEVLMKGSRGANKSPGRFRTSQNWIGGVTAADATFVPPEHRLVGDLMSDLEKFLHNRNNSLPGLVKIGMAHYQFETIHPFLDGNGRVGRLLIVLFLSSEEMLREPLLYISSYFERDRYLYYEKLSGVRRQNDMIGWIKYFLIGVERAAAQAAETLEAMLILRADLENEIQAKYGKRVAVALRLLNGLFKSPVCRRSDIQEWLASSPRSANELVNSFVRDGYMMEKTGRSRNQIFEFHPLMRLFKDH